MIQKLRKKFVLVNMLLVSVVLLVVFGAVCFSSYHRLRRGCLDALHQAISRPMDDKPPRLELGEVKRPPQWQAEMAPVFVVELSGDGRLRLSGDRISQSIPTASHRAPPRRTVRSSRSQARHDRRKQRRHRIFVHA